MTKLSSSITSPFAETLNEGGMASSFTAVSGAATVATTAAAAAAAAAVATGSLTNATSRPNADALTDDPLLRDLTRVYKDLSTHRKAMTGLMARVKKCLERAERRPRPRSGRSGSGGEDATSDTCHGKTPRHRSGAAASSTTSTRRGGLLKPCDVSSTLCAFMSVPDGTQLARAEVTKYLHKYIRDKDLYSKTNRQFIVPDHSLKTLLNIADDEPVHVFAMQKRMNPHFVYGPSATSAATTTTPSAAVTNMSNDLPAAADV